MPAQLGRAAGDNGMHDFLLFGMQKEELMAVRSENVGEVGFFSPLSTHAPASSACPDFASVSKGVGVFVK